MNVIKIVFASLLLAGMVCSTNFHEFSMEVYRCTAVVCKEFLDKFDQKQLVECSTECLQPTYPEATRTLLESYDACVGDEGDLEAECMTYLNPGLGTYLKCFGECIGDTEELLPEEYVSLLKKEDNAACMKECNSVEA